MCQSGICVHVTPIWTCTCFLNVLWTNPFLMQPMLAGGWLIVGLAAGAGSQRTLCLMRTSSVRISKRHPIRDSEVNTSTHARVVMMGISCAGRHDSHRTNAFVSCYMSDRNRTSHWKKMLLILAIKVEDEYRCNKDIWQLPMDEDSLSFARKHSFLPLIFPRMSQQREL